MKNVDPDGGPVWMQLRDNLRAAIMSGELAGRLSAGRIAQEQGVAAGTVKKALAALRGEGLVRPVAGWGWAVVHGAPPAPDGSGRAP